MLILSLITLSIWSITGPQFPHGSDRFLTRRWSFVAQISDTYKRKIESMVRKGSKNADRYQSTPTPKHLFGLEAILE